MKHAIFSPSASERILDCVGSLSLTEQLQIESGGHSIYTAEGTATHGLAEQVLRTKFLDAEDPSGILDDAVGHTWSYYDDNLGDFGKNKMTVEMVDMVRDYLAYAEMVIDPQDKVYVEKRLTYNPILFGTIDLLVVKPSGDVHLIDLKTGAGKQVNANHPKWGGNPQLMCYAMCYAQEYGHTGVKRWHLTIVQPTYDPIVDSHQVTPRQLEVFSDEVVNALYMHKEGLAQRKVCDGCRWCPARAACPTLEVMAIDAVERPYDGMGPDQWSGLLELADRLEPWIKAVRERAQMAAEQGMEIPERKLVRRYGRKTWSDQASAAETLSDAGVPKDVMYNAPTLRTPTQLSKEAADFIGKDSIEELTEVPERGTLLVTASDKRKAIKTISNRIKALGEQLKLPGVS